MKEQTHPDVALRPSVRAFLSYGFRPFFLLGAAWARDRVAHVHHRASRRGAPLPLGFARARPLARARDAVRLRRRRNRRISADGGADLDCIRACAGRSARDAGRIVAGRPCRALAVARFARHAVDLARRRVLPGARACRGPGPRARAQLPELPVHDFLAAARRCGLRVSRRPISAGWCRRSIRCASPRIW